MSRLSPQGSSFSEIVIEIFRLNRLLLDAGDEITKPVGLSSAKWQVLGVVEHGACSMTDVARIMGLTRQGVRQTANMLVKEGMIQFVDNPNHLRSKLMEITPKGKIALDYIHKHHAKWADKIGNKHNSKTLQIVLNELRALQTSLVEHEFHI
ncbi:MarR family winged helix-turn-helix transcriptional regulator [Leptospira idonii]|uniref:MarR family transcriptional regulator n=1 Tax=Leptospira idonii TaxID=1193500 RepID=A0A4R9M2Q5_9LEPT|nr:MarR family transcriptional regulator [Leptospira idonii]TGN21060.1 MarR family transcriptional regulator [Leptospira idonii]